MATQAQGDNTSGATAGTPARSGTGNGTGTRLEAAHAAMVLATLAVGESLIGPWGEEDDLALTAAACRGFGALVSVADGSARVHGVGIGGVVRPAGVLCLARGPLPTALFAGLAAGHEAGAALMPGEGADGEADTVVLAGALAGCGATVAPVAGPPGAVEVRGARDPLPCDRTQPLPPAVACAALVAGLNAPGETRVVTTGALPGAVEALLGLFGARLAVVADGDDRRLVLAGRPELRPACIDLARLVAGMQGEP